MDTKEIRTLAKAGAELRVAQLHKEINTLSRTFGLTVVNNITGKKAHWTQTPTGSAKASRAQRLRWRRIKRAEAADAAK